jgi:DUF4097 and DUF4098 domain-containing protein YvlB
MKLKLKKVFVNPKDNFAIIEDSNPDLYKDAQGGGYLNVTDGRINFQKLITTVMVDDEKAVRPVWFKKLKELGIEIQNTAGEIDVDVAEEEEYSYKQHDGTFVRVLPAQVLKSDKGYVTLVDGVVRALHKRIVKKYSICGVDVGSQYFYNKLLGLETSKKE